MKTKASTLDGRALTWATCVALGHTPVLAATGIAYRDDQGTWVYPTFTDDASLGQLLRTEWVSLERPSKAQPTPTWRAVSDTKRPQKLNSYVPVVSATGDTPGVAVCRCVVISRCGEVVDVHAELMPTEQA